MKKAFTMIEVIYVIIILGVLLGFAIPVLSNIRNDASAMVARKNINTLMNDFRMFYSTNGGFSRPDGELYSLNQITNTLVDSIDDEMAIVKYSRLGRMAMNNLDKGAIKVAGDECLCVSIINDYELKLELGNKPNRVCKQVLSDERVKSLFTNFSKKHCLPYHIDKNHNISLVDECSILTFLSCSIHQ